MRRLTHRLREQARSHIGSVLSGRRYRRSETLVHAISQQLRQLYQLRNAEQFLSFRAFQVKGKVATQRIGRGEGFAEVDQQVFVLSGFTTESRIPLQTLPNKLAGSAKSPRPNLPSRGFAPASAMGMHCFCSASQLANMYPKEYDPR